MMPARQPNRKQPTWQRLEHAATKSVEKYGLCTFLESSDNLRQQFRNNAGLIDVSQARIREAEFIAWLSGGMQ